MVRDRWAYVPEALSRAWSYRVQTLCSMRFPPKRVGTMSEFTYQPLSSVWPWSTQCTGRNEQFLKEGMNFLTFQWQNKDLGMLSNLPFQGYFLPKSKSKLVTKIGDLSSGHGKGTQEAAQYTQETPEQGGLDRQMWVFLLPKAWAEKSVQIPQGWEWE